MRRLFHGGGFAVGVRDESTTFSPEPDHEAVHAFDIEGRPISWFEGGRLFKRSLASVVHGRDRRERTKRRFVEPEERAREHFARIREVIASIPKHGFDDEVAARIDRILTWTSDTLLAERARFEAAYLPISILPPDQYLAVVLQATFGCTWNRCTFCDFYQDRPFRTRPLQEIDAHVSAVQSLLGRGETLRKRIFLADGNALTLANDKLLPILARAREAFPGRTINGFLDVFTGERKSREEWQELRRHGIERVHLGIETGHDPLLAFLNKPGGTRLALDLVTTLREAGLKVAIILMCGVGGRRYADAHLRDTIDLTMRMPLGSGDIVYLSPFLELEGSEYRRRAREEGVVPLDDTERDAQYRTMRDAVLAHHPGVRAALYDLREFIY